MTWQNATSGFSLIELLTAFVLMSVALTGAVAGYRDWQQRSLIAEHLSLWTNTLRFARNYALISGKTTTLCPSDDTRAHCHGSDYAKGWLVFTGDDEIAENDDPRGRIIARSDGWHSALTLRSNFSRPVRFDANGRARANGRFVLCFNDDPRSIRGIFLIRSGRIRLAGNDELTDCL